MSAVLWVSVVCIVAQSAARQNGCRRNRPYQVVFAKAFKLERKAPYGPRRPPKSCSCAPARPVSCLHKPEFPLLMQDPCLGTRHLPMGSRCSTQGITRPKEVTGKLLLCSRQTSII